MSIGAKFFWPVVVSQGRQHDIMYHFKTSCVALISASIMSRSKVWPGNNGQCHRGDVKGDFHTFCVGLRPYYTCLVGVRDKVRFNGGEVIFTVRGLSDNNQ